jgi:serine/threonine protein kinase
MLSSRTEENQQPTINKHGKARNYHLLQLMSSFPPFTCYHGVLDNINIFDQDGISFWSQQQCIVSQEISFGFQVDRETMKELPYGGIYKGRMLELFEGKYRLVMENNRIIIKTFKISLTENPTHADNPLQEFAVLQYVGDEKSIMPRTNPGHPNVAGQIALLKDDDYYYSVMRDAGQDLRHIIFKTSASYNSKHIFRQVLCGMEYLQSLGVCHRDISVDNLTIDDNSQVYIIDFGMALLLPLDHIHGTPYLFGPCDPRGKMKYMPPEIYNRQPFDGFKSDMWSLGIALFVLLTKQYLVKSVEPAVCKIYPIIKCGQLYQLIQHWNRSAGFSISADAADLLCSLLQAEHPGRRPSLALTMQHRWLREEDWG